MAMMRIGSDDEDSEESDGLPALVSSSDDDERLRNFRTWFRNNHSTVPGQSPGQGPTRNEPLSWTSWVQCDNCTEIAGRFTKDEPNQRWLIAVRLEDGTYATSDPYMIVKSFRAIGQTDTWAVQWIKVNRKCCRT